MILGVANGLISAVLHSLLVTQATYDLTTGTYTAPSGLLLYAVVNGIVMAALLFGYEFIMLRTQGRTVGKIVLGLQVAQVGGATGNLDNGAILKRAAVLWGPFVLYAIPVVGAFLVLPVYLVNVLWQLWDKPLRQCLHDKAARTVVVKA
ncbi:RDD family protein [Thermostaphylospora chromogena]|uniref:RDD family protein n=1 Tax=Thermostaphylospora chromogena TaxID=35622 RepID=UPI001F61D624|nr:RDD family protein [Thermostaphylospora chromogena]